MLRNKPTLMRKRDKSKDVAVYFDILNGYTRAEVIKRNNIRWHDYYNIKRRMNPNELRSYIFSLYADEWRNSEEWDLQDRMDAVAKISYRESLNAQVVWSLIQDQINFERVRPNLKKV